MKLTAEELRVLCVLVEKSYTTPDQYPMTTNALVIGCNQRTSRDPVVSYTAGEVDATMQNLRASGWARTVRMTGSRTNKHKHVVTEQLPVNDEQLALLAVLGLRGAQSPGELKTRTERYVGFESFGDVVDQLEAMAGMADPLVRNVGTRSGQSQDRWIHLLADPGDSGVSDPGTVVATASALADVTSQSTGGEDLPGRADSNRDQTIRTLQQKVADLEDRVNELENIVSRLTNVDTDGE